MNSSTSKSKLFGVLFLLLVLSVEPVSAQTLSVTPAPASLFISFGAKGTPDASWDTAEELLATLSNLGVQAIEVDKYLNGGWTSHLKGLPFNNFEIKKGEGYLIKYQSKPPADMDCHLTYSDINLPANSHVYNLPAGNNFISFPSRIVAGNPILKDAKSVCLDINKDGDYAIKISYWDEFYQKIQDYDCQNALISQNFLIQAGKGYFITNKTAYNWEVNPPSADIMPNDLIADFDYLKFFQENNDFGYDPINQTNKYACSFGAYVMEPAGDKLYIGLSSGDPGNHDGALLAVYENGTLTPLGLCMDESCTNIKRGLTEQGVHDMTFINGKLYIAGTDPCCPDGWEFGNVYTLVPGQNIIKHRNLPNVLHTLGLWVDPANNDIYAATGAHTGDNKTWTALLFRSHDGASSWENPVNVYNDISSTGKVLRVTDIIGFNNKLYAIRASNSSLAGLVEATEYGQAWKIPPNLAVYTNLKPRLLLYQDSLLFLGSGGHIIWSLNKEGKESRFILPGIKLRGDVWSAFSNENDNFLYVVSDKGLIARTNDLVSWYQVGQIDQPQEAISYWPNKNMLVFSESGPQAKIQTIDLSQVVSPSIIPTPTNPPIVYASFGPKGVPDTSWDNAEELLNVLSQSGFDINSVSRLLNGALDIHIYRTPFNNFEIKAGEGYLVGFQNYLPANFDPQLVFSDIDKFIYNLTTSWNFVSFPQQIVAGNPLLKDAQSICLDLNKNAVNIVEIDSYDERSQSFTSYKCENPEADTNFPIQSAKGYNILSNKAFSWEPTSTIQPSTSPTPTHCTPLGDIDCSGQVGILDLSALLANFGKKTGDAGFNLKADLDNSGEVTILDLSTLLSNFGLP